MNAKYVACVLIFLSFSVFSYGESEQPAIAESASKAVPELPSLPACVGNYRSGTSDPSASHKPSGNSVTGGEENGLGDVLDRLTCLLASN